jgi:TolB protein
MRIPRLGAALSVAVAALAAVPAARADVFDGRIAFGSYRVAPETSGDIFTMNADGSDVRRITTSPEADRQPDWSPGGTDIAYSIRKPGQKINFEVARIGASGRGYRRLTTSPEGQASSQPSWFPNGRGILLRRSGPGTATASIWQMGTAGQAPYVRIQPPHPPLYPTWAPDMSKVLFTAILSPTGDTDRGIFTVGRYGGQPTTLFDMPGTFDSAPAWSPDGRRIAFESDANIAGGNPEGDLEIWTMNADGSDVRQLTRNALHDEGPAWSPDGGRYLAYTSGVDNTHGDINVMTASGRHLRTITDYPGLDESPDWQSIPAPKTARRCGNAVKTGAGARDVRARGLGLRCERVLSLARRWTLSGRPTRISGFAVKTKGFGGTSRVVMTRHEDGRGQLVAFLDQRG